MIWREREEWTRFGLSILGSIVAILVVVVLINALWGTGINHEDLDARLTVVEYEARFQSCMIRIPPTERTAAAVAECQTTALTVP